MAKPSPWPRRADDARIETIAILADIESIAVRAYHLGAAGDAIGHAQALAHIRRQTHRASTLLRVAKDEPEKLPTIIDASVETFRRQIEHE